MNEERKRLEQRLTKRDWLAYLLIASLEVFSFGLVLGVFIRTIGPWNTVNQTFTAVSGWGFMRATFDLQVRESSAFTCNSYPVTTPLGSCG